MSENGVFSKMKRAKSPSGALDSQYLNSITTLNDNIIAGAIKQKDHASASSLLSKLQQSILSGHYGTYSKSKKHYHYHLYVCYYNMAVVDQERNDNPQAKNHLEKAIHELQKIHGFITNREENLVFSAEIIKAQLQYCGLLSHCSLHQEAATLAEKSLDRIIEGTRILQAICYQQALFHAQRQTTSSSRERGSKNQCVDFKTIVIQQAQTILQDLAAAAPTHKLLNDNKSYFQSIMARIFAWKQNEANNEAAIRKQLKVSQQRSARTILGLQKQPVPDEYQIGSFMTLNCKQIQYAPHPDPLRLLSSLHLRQLAFLAALAYFTMATETRFSQSDLSDMRGSMKIDQKYKKLNHDERLLRCKILHLKALEMAGKLLPNGNAIFAHLAQSFCRNYKFVMDQISEVSQMNSTRFEKGMPELPKDEPSLESEYGIMKVPKRNERNTHSKLERSKSQKSKKQPLRRSKSQNKSKGTSIRKKSEL